MVHCGFLHPHHDRPSRSSLQRNHLLSDPKHITADWQRWIAENVLLENDQKDLVKILIQNGFAAEVAEREVRAAAAHPYVEAARTLARKLKKRDWVLETYRTLERTSANAKFIIRTGKLPYAEFFDGYYTKNRPVVMQGALDGWRALSAWTPEYLKRNLGDRVVEIQANRAADEKYEINSAQLKSQVKFGDYIDRITAAGSTNDCYMTATNAGHNSQALAELWNDIDRLPEYLKDDPSNRGFFWCGPAGTVTPLHHDLTNNFMAQVRGRKLIKLISPDYLPCLYNHLHCYSQVDLDNIDYERFPLFRNARVIEFVLEPGELFFLPVGWWHYVRALDMSITMTFTNFLVDNNFSSFYQNLNEI